MQLDKVPVQRSPGISTTTVHLADDERPERSFGQSFRGEESEEENQEMDREGGIRMAHDGSCGRITSDDE